MSPASRAGNRDAPRLERLPQRLAECLDLPAAIGEHEPLLARMQYGDHLGCVGQGRDPVDRELWLAAAAAWIDHAPRASAHPIM